MALLHFTMEAFHAALEAKTPLLVDFWADWCIPCQAMNPIIEDMAKEYEGKLTIAKANVTDVGELAMQMSVMSVPTMIFFKDGKEVHREVGILQAPDLRKLIDQYLF